MAVGGGWVWDEPFTANEDMNAYQYHAVTTGSVAREIKLAVAGSAPIPIGVLQNDPNELEEATVRIKGRTKCWVDADTEITYGDFLFSGSIGHLRYAAGSVVSAIALEALASGSAVIEVLWLGNMFAEAPDNTP